MQLMGWIITGFVVVLLIAYGAALISLRSIPLGERPRTPTYDRFGNPIGERENPDYHENPGEDERQEPGKPVVG